MNPRAKKTKIVPGPKVSVLEWLGDAYKVVTNKGETISPDWKFIYDVLLEEHSYMTTSMARAIMNYVRIVRRPFVFQAPAE